MTQLATFKVAIFLTQGKENSSFEVSCGPTSGCFCTSSRGLSSQPIRRKTQASHELAYTIFPALFTGCTFLSWILIGWRSLKCSVSNVLNINEITPKTTTNKWKKPTGPPTLICSSKRDSIELSSSSIRFGSLLKATGFGSVRHRGDGAGVFPC